MTGRELIRRIVDSKAEDMQIVVFATNDDGHIAEEDSAEIIEISTFDIEEERDTLGLVINKTFEE